MPNANQQFLFLQKPNILPELNAWVENRLQSKEHFTFTEEDVLNPLWQQGVEIRLREDCRFRRVRFSDSHWYLTQQTLSNEQLYEALLDEIWNGNDLAGYLGQRNTSGAIHVYCPDDNRFRLIQIDDTLKLALTEANSFYELTSEQRQYLKELMTAFLSTSRLYSSAEILAELDKRYPKESIEPVSLEAWLATQLDWARVGLDQWLPLKDLPKIGSSPRYAVKPISGNTFDFQLVEPDNQPETIIEESITPRTEDFLSDQISWKVTLRTWHLNEGILSVPLTARHLYPRARKLTSPVALQGLWFDDGSNLIIWLDKTRHKLFGTDLQEKLDYLGAGVILKVRWSQAGITFNLVGEDDSVNKEEARLIDLSALTEVRSHQLESYRASLHKLLVNEPQSFHNLYEQLCARQQHHVNKNTVRSLLSGLSEFEFDRVNKHWKLNPLVSEQTDARILRRTLLINQITSDADNHITSPNLSEVISYNKQKLGTLWQRYLGGNL